MLPHAQGIHTKQCMHELQHYHLKCYPFENHGFLFSLFNTILKCDYHKAAVLPNGIISRVVGEKIYVLPFVSRLHLSSSLRDISLHVLRFRVEPELCVNVMVTVCESCCCDINSRDRRETLMQ